ESGACLAPPSDSGGTDGCSASCSDGVAIDLTPLARDHYGNGAWIGTCKRSYLAGWTDHKLSARFLPPRPPHSPRSAARRGHLWCDWHTFCITHVKGDEAEKGCSSPPSIISP